jgi:hypothetical protein
MSDIDTTLPTAASRSSPPIAPSASVAGSTVSTMHDVEVLVTSPEAALDGVAEFRCHGRLIGFTLLQAESSCLNSRSVQARSRCR